MKILVTGGAGFIGSHTVDRLVKDGYEVRVIDSLEQPVHPKREQPSYLNSEAEYIFGNVQDKAVWEKSLKSVEAVFHLAAYQNYLIDFSQFALVNDVGTALLYEVILKNKYPVKKIVLASSQAVYGEGKYQCAEHGVQYPLPRKLDQLEKKDWSIKCPVCGGELSLVKTNEETVNPHNQYAVSKYAQELYALTLGRRYEIPTVALRYSITQGPRQSIHNAYSGILRVFTTRMMSSMPPVIFEDGQQIRDYVHVLDVVEANILAFKDDAANYQAFNVGGDNILTVREYADLLISAIGTSIEPKSNGEFRFGDTRHIISDISKLKNLGWNPLRTIDIIINDYISWIQKQPDVVDSYSQAERIMKQQGVIREVK